MRMNVLDMRIACMLDDRWHFLTTTHDPPKLVLFIKYLFLFVPLDTHAAHSHRSLLIALATSIQQWKKKLNERNGRRQQTNANQKTKKKKLQNSLCVRATLYTMLGQ